jgi:hypothetical protein
MPSVSAPGTQWAVSSSMRLRMWERLMHSAAQAALTKKLAQAQRLYERALLLSQALYDEVAAQPASTPDAHLAAYVLTRLTVADLHRAMGEPELAGHGLCLAHRALLVLTRDHRVALGARQAAFRRARQTHAALLAHVAEQGASPNVLHTLRVGGMPLAAHDGSTLH